MISPVLDLATIAVVISLFIGSGEFLRVVEDLDRIIRRHEPIEKVVRPPLRLQGA